MRIHSSLFKPASRLINDLIIFLPPIKTACIPIPLSQPSFMVLSQDSWWSLSFTTKIHHILRLYTFHLHFFPYKRNSRRISNQNTREFFFFIFFNSTACNLIIITVIIIVFLTHSIIYSTSWWFILCITIFSRFVTCYFYNTWYYVCYGSENNVVM